MSATKCPHCGEYYMTVEGEDRCPFCKRKPSYDLPEGFEAFFGLGGEK